MSIEEPVPRDDLLAELICQYEEAIRSGTEPPVFDGSAVAIDADLLARFDAARNGLEALNRVCMLWSPLDEATYDAEDQTASDVAQTIDSKGRTIGRFRLQWELGRGGLGVVFLAHDPKLHRQVAIKVPRLEALVNDEIRDRFMREAELAARLNHPNLVGVYEVGEEAGICYIAAEYCPGSTLRQWIAERGAAVPARLAARILGHLARAVQYAHGRGVLHRDIKPSNVLVEESSESDSVAQAKPGDTPTVKLADFGMAKLIEHGGDHTRSGAILGTLAYMAPEQAKGHTSDIDVRTDVFGLGAVLYELLTGRPPFQSDTEADTLRQVLLCEVRHPSRTRPDVPRDLEVICLKCLEKNPRHRYATAQELGDDLERFLDGRATEARPLRWPETVWKWVRRRPWAAAIVTLAILSASAVLATVLVYNARLKVVAESRRRLLYSADVRLAYETLNANNVVQTIEALDRQIPAPGESDLREFAWHYLQRRCEPNLRTLRGHENTVFAVAFSPAGDRLASASQDGTARIWDVATGKAIRILRGHTGEVTSVAFVANGGSLATGSEDCSIRIWDADSGETTRILEGHQDHVQAVAVSPAGRWLASGSRDGTVRVWSPATGAIQATFDDNLDVVRAVAFSPSGDRLFAVDEAECLHVWDTSDWIRVARERADRDKLFSVAVARDGTRVAAAGRRRKLNFWSLKQEQVNHLQTLESGHTEWVQTLAFSPVDETLASGGKDGVIRFWTPGDTVPERVLLGHKGRIWSIAWAPDGKTLASAGESAKIRLWDLNQAITIRYPVMDAPANCMRFTPDGTTLLVSLRTPDAKPRQAGDGVIQVWNPNTRKLIETFRAHSHPIRNLSFSPDGSLLASNAKDGLIKIWSGTPWREIRQLAGAGDVISAWGPKGRRLAWGDETRLAILDVESGAVVQRWTTASPVREIDFTPDGRQLVVTSIEAFEIWDIATMRNVYRIAKGHTDLEVTSTGSAVAAIAGAMVTLIDLEAGFRRSTLVTTAIDAKCLAFSPDGNTLAVATLSPAAVSLWDRRTGHQMVRLSFDAEFINSISFSPDGQSLLVSGADADLKGGIWEWTIRSENR